jgi:hypothetical protein
MWSDTLGAFYYAGEAVLANHGPHVEDVPLPISEKRLREMWGDPMDSETRPDGFLGIAWPTRRADEIVYAMAKDGTVFFLGRGVRGPK